MNTSEPKFQVGQLVRITEDLWQPATTLLPPIKAGAIGKVVQSNNEWSSVEFDCLHRFVSNVILELVEPQEHVYEWQKQILTSDPIKKMIELLSAQELEINRLNAEIAERKEIEVKHVATIKSLTR